MMAIKVSISMENIYISFKIFHAWWIYTIENSWKKHWRENKACLIIGCPLYFSTTVTISSICIVFNFSYSQNINRGWWSKNVYISKYVCSPRACICIHANERIYIVWYQIAKNLICIKNSERASKYVWRELIPCLSMICFISEELTGFVTTH